MTPKPARCANCGKRMVDHYAVNYSNGNLIFADVYICPTAIYTVPLRKAKEGRFVPDAKNARKRG